MLPRFTLAFLAAGFALPALAQPPAAQGPTLTAMPEGASRVSEMIGTAVTGSDIRRLGEVKDVVLDREGRAVAVVIASGGMLGMGEKNVAVPFEALLWNYDVSPTEGASSSNTGGVPARDGRTLEARRAETTSPGPENVEATGTVGDPAQPDEGLRPQGATTPVTGSGSPSSAVLRMTVDELRNAPEFQSR
jgi:sporulation protein YlmC with PRC-barrel domain